jgi:hypothetical protein
MRSNDHVDSIKRELRQAYSVLDGITEEWIEGYITKGEAIEQEAVVRELIAELWDKLAEVDRQRHDDT